MSDNTKPNLVDYKKLLNALDASDLGMWEVNCQTGAGTFDYRWLESFGYQIDRSDATMEFWKSMVDPEDLGRVEKELVDFLNGGEKSFLSEYRIRTKDGNWTWVRDRGKIIEWDDNEKPLKIVGTHQNIQNSKNTEEVLIQEKNKLESVISAMGDGLTVQDRNFKIVYQNSIQIQRQGKHKGHYCYKAYQGKDEVCEGCLVVKCFADGNVHRRETSSIGPDGKEIFMEVSASPVRDSKGNIVAGVETVRDITQRKLLEKQLQQTQKLESIGTLAGGIAHDFNNILSAIFGYAELVQLDLPKDSTTWKMQSELINASYRAKELVQQILSFSRKEDHELKPINLHKVIMEALKMLRASIPTTIEIAENIDRDAGAVLADPTQIHQVLMNLCTNSYHAMAEKGGVLSVDLEKVFLDNNDKQNLSKVGVPAGAYVCITVSDTGTGMEQATLERVFDPYYTTKEKGEGTGLGLAVVHGIIKNYGGFITVDSQPGEGTSFKIYLPQAEGSVHEQNDLGHEILPGGSERILIVDDEKSVIDMQRKILTGLGYRVAAMTDSEKALELFAASPNDFDLIITDMTMPKMTGAQLSSELLAICPDLSIIICTGYSPLMDEKKAKKIGVKKMLTKPVSRKDLAIAIRSIFGE